MITFGICTDGKSDQMVKQCIDSIWREFGYDNKRVLVVGGEKRIISGATVIPFDETQKPKGWITKKKNLITEHAIDNIIVYMHDYVELLPGWSAAWRAMGYNFEVGINRVLTAENTRHADWLIFSHDMWDIIPESKDNWDVALPYELRGMQSLQYVSGGFWIAKKSFMEQYPLNENLLWGEYEDIEWNKRIRDKITFFLNPYATVRLMKPGKWAPKIIRWDWLTRIVEAKKLQPYFQNI